MPPTACDGASSRPRRSVAGETTTTALVPTLTSARAVSHGPLTTARPREPPLLSRYYASDAWRGYGDHPDETFGRSRCD
jgi:hypothetical protein